MQQQQVNMKWVVIVPDGLKAVFFCSLPPTLFAISLATGSRDKNI
jgi:hypothetical protein